MLQEEKVFKEETVLGSNFTLFNTAMLFMALPFFGNRYAGGAVKTSEKDLRRAILRGISALLPLNGGFK